MPKADTIANEYMRENEHFADLFNFYLYKGEQIITPESLTELNRSAAVMPFGSEEGSSEVTEKYRDVFKSVTIKTDGNTSYALLGIEDQTHVHYAMPVRNMLYDAMSYSNAVDYITRQHRRKKEFGTGSDEFLSGFHKTDRLHPVITLVLYWSPDKWDGPVSIHEMLDTDNEEILRYVPDYKINLLEPEQIQKGDFGCFRTQLGKVLEILKDADDYEKFIQIINSDPEYKLSRESLELISALTGASVTIPEGKEEIAVRNAFVEMRRISKEEGLKEGMEQGLEQGLEQGIEKGLKQGIQKGAETTQATNVRRMSSLGVGVDKIADFLGLTVDKVTEILQTKSAV